MPPLYHAAPSPEQGAPYRTLTLNALAWQACTSPLEIRDLATAREAIDKAVELLGRKEAAILNTLARVDYALGLLESAIAVQAEAVSLSQDDEEKKAFQETLAYYKNALALSREASPP